jgi:enolase
LPLYGYIAQLCRVDPLLPLPMVNMISGGMHAGHNLDIQDVLIMPAGAATYSVALQSVVRVYAALRSLLIQMGHPPLVGDEGGFGPSLSSNEEALQTVTRAISLAGLRPGRDVALALDVAATQFHRAGTYHLQHEGEGLRALASRDMVALVGAWAGRYPLISVEDALAEDDWDGWNLLTMQVGYRIQLIGDDLFTTSSERVQRGIVEKAGNAVLIKVNQIGTLTGALKTLQLARDAGYATVISARSGETEDDWLADLAVGTAAGQIKVGSVARAERLAKYNRLIRIEEELGIQAPYAGGAAWSFPPKSHDG